MAIALGLYVETIDDYEGAPGQVSLVQAWAEADREPGVREMLAAGASGSSAPARSCCTRGSRRGELPAWIDVDAVTRGLPRPARRAAPPAHRGRRAPTGRPTCERRAAAMVELILLRPRRPSAGAGPLRRGRRDRRRRSIAADGARPDRPRADRPGRARVHPAARAHPDRAVAHPGALGLLAADPRRAGHPRRARAVPGGRRERPRRPDPARRRARSGLARAASPGRAGSTSSWAAAGTGPPTTRPRR